MTSNSPPPGILSLEDFPAFLETQKGLSRYSSSVEKKPIHPWYQIDKGQVDDLLKGFKQAVVELLKGSPEDDTELQQLIRHANDVARVLRKPPVKVALLGAQGAGKSLMTNAIFECDGLSLTGADGAACTSSITKYVAYANEANSASRFIAEVRFLDPAKREALLEEHALSYYQYQHADEDSDDEDSPIPKKRKRENNDEMDVRLKDTALDVFTTLFSSQDAFLDHWSAESYRNKEFVRTCKLKCEEALQNEGPDLKGVVIKSAQDQQSLSRQIKPFLTKVPNVDCLWPLVDSVTVHFNNELLRAGIEFIDLPGWGDLNLSRARHVEEINDSVDVVLILTDTIRITSEDKLVRQIRSAVAHRGASKVKIIATKIDALTRNQLSQYTGGVYDNIKQLEKMADDEEALLDDDGDLETFVRKDQIAKYKSYLARAMLQAKVKSRVDAITNDFAAKLQTRNSKDLPQIFHTSASEYMEWIKPARINFKDQPSLPVEMTGIPAIRDFLFTLPANQNLQDYEDHIYNKLPAFLDRIERTVDESDRDGGFICISEEFNKARKRFMAKQMSGVKAQFQTASNASIAEVASELPTIKDSVQDLINDEWCSLKAAALTRILKSRGVVPKGLSKARGLEAGADWNKDLATLLTPIFNKWSKAQHKHIQNMLATLAKNFDAFHRRIHRMISEAPANVPTVEKGKQKWEPFKWKVFVRLEGLMDDIENVHSRKLEWATMEYERQSSLISDITDDIYIEVFNSVPELKPPGPKAKKPSKQYVMPKVRFQQAKLSEKFLTPDNHFVDRAINHFQSEFDKSIRHTLDKHFAGIEEIFKQFDDKVRAQCPINYKLRPDGKAIRTDVKGHIPELQKRIDQLKSLLPTPATQEQIPEEDHSYGVTGRDDDDDDFATAYDKVSKRKKTAPPVGSRPHKLTKQETM